MACHGGSHPEAMPGLATKHGSDAAILVCRGFLDVTFHVLFTLLALFSDAASRPPEAINPAFKTGRHLANRAVFHLDIPRDHVPGEKDERFISTARGP